MEYKKINELTAVVTGGTPSTRKNEYWDNGDIPWLQSGCCQNCDVDSTEKYITKEGYNNSSTHMMPADTVMIALTGATAGKVGYLKFEACGNQSITGILPCESLNQRYLFFYLLSQREKILADCVGGAQAHISQSYVKNMTIPILAIKEQEQIVGELTKLSNIVSLRQEEIQQLDALIKARFVELFGDAIHNDKGWENDTVEKLCKEIYGGGTPSKSHPEYYEDGDIPWVSSKDMKTDVLTDSQIKINQLGVDNSTARMIPINSVIMVIRSGILKHTLPVAINAVPITVNQDLKVFIPNERVLTRFLAIQFKMHEKDILSGVRAVTADNIEFNSLKQRELIVPPIELQQEYVTFLEQIDKSKVAVQKALDETQILFDSLMQKYFG